MHAGASPISRRARSAPQRLPRGVPYVPPAFHLFEPDPRFLGDGGASGTPFAVNLARGAPVILLRTNIVRVRAATIMGAINRGTPVANGARLHDDDIAVN